MCLITGLSSGGAERQITGLAKMIKESGRDVLVVWYAKGDFYKSFLLENNIPHKELHAEGNFEKCRSIYKTIKEYKPTTVISFLTGPNIITCLLKMLGMNFHLVVSDRNTNSTLSGKVRLRFFLYKWADIIVPNSYSQGAFIKSHYPALSGKVDVISNFTDTKHFVPDSSFQCGNIIRVLTVARILKQKNVLGYIKASRKLKDAGLPIHLDWYGDDSDITYKSECDSLIKKLDVEDVFAFHPSTKDVLKVYQSADVFCLPSFKEGFPNVVCEAMSCGMPILCSNVCDNPHIVENGVNGLLFDPENIDSIVDSVIKYVNEYHPIRNEIGIRNRNKILELCSKEAFLQKYQNIIK